MNMAFLIEVEAYPKNGGEPEYGRVVATGSQETRARRRVLDALHADGRFVRRMRVVDSKPARELEGGER